MGPTTISLLFGVNADRKLGHTGRHGWQGYWGCNYCFVDDDAALGSFFSFSALEFGDALTASKEHQLWEKLFCEKGRTNKEFAGMKGCKIVLSDCHKEDDEAAVTFITNGYAAVDALAKKHAKEVHGIV